MPSITSVGICDLLRRKWLLVSIVASCVLPSPFCSGQGSTLNTQHAQLSYKGGNQLELSVGVGAWPEEQLLARLRREYGWTIDFEQTPQPTDMLTTEAQGQVHPKPHSLKISIPQPIAGTEAEEFQILKSFSNALGSDSVSTTIIKSTDDSRFDVIMSTSGAEPILSSLITLPSAQRSVESTIELILQLVGTQTGQRVLRGGIADPSLSTTSITIGSTQPVPARTLLAEALATLPIKHVWLMTYEPQGQYYAFGIEPVVRSIRRADGQSRDLFVRNSNAH